MLTRDQFFQEFEDCKGQLKSYLLRITASVPDTEDLMQETFLKAAERYEGFKGQSSVKTWLFAIATNLTKDNLRARKRWVENVTDIARAAAFADSQFLGDSMHIRQTSPHGEFEIREHISFCFTCIAKSLPLEQQVCVLLKEVYEFRTKEIAIIIDRTEAMVKYYLHEGRNKLMQIFEGRCALINKEGICHQCSELNGLYNPKQRFQEEIVKLDLAREDFTANREHLFDLRTKLVQGIDPFTSNASELELHHLAFNNRVMDDYLEKKPA